VRRAVRAFLDQAPELRPWSLKFKDGWLERRFQDTYFEANIQYIRIATFLGAVTWAAFGPLALLVVDDNEGVVLDSVIRYGLGVPTGLVSLALTYLSNYRRIWQPMITAAILFSGLVWVIHRAFVAEARVDWGYAGNMLILIFAYILSRLQFRYSALAGVALIVMHNVGAIFTDESGIDLIFGDYFLLVTAFIGTIGAYVLERSQRLLFLRDRELDRERGRSEGLLRNILPEQIVERLKERDPATEHGRIAQAFDEVTVVFADLVDFTQQSGRSQPPEIVEVLDEVFSRFDGLAERFGLEKIKTIGDAYMGRGRRSRIARGRRRGGGADGPRDARGGPVAPMAERRCDERPDRDGHRAGGGRCDRHTQVRLRPVGRHREHGRADGVEWRPRRDPGLGRRARSPRRSLPLLRGAHREPEGQGPDAGPIPDGRNGTG
jgi:Adenylate and Guanylate cyclase catalytic domain